MPISARDIEYLRRQTLDRDAWAWSDVEYLRVAEPVDFDPMTKEPVGGYQHVAPVVLKAKVRVTPPRVIVDPRTGGATVTEHEVSFRFGAQQLAQANIVPRAGDRLRMLGVEYRIQQVKTDQYLSNHPAHLDIEVVVTRVEDTAVPDLPQPL
jgi:hypothetical protein